MGSQGLPTMRTAGHLFETSPDLPLQAVGNPVCPVGWASGETGKVGGSSARRKGLKGSGRDWMSCGGREDARENNHTGQGGDKDRTVVRSKDSAKKTSLSISFSCLASLQRQCTVQRSFQGSELLGDFRFAQRFLWLQRSRSF